MKLDIQKLEGFATTTQMSIGRAFERFMILNAKPVKTNAEVLELDRHRKTLAPFDADAAPVSISAPDRREEKAAEVAELNRGVVLNQVKVDAANMSGAQRLALHRQSAALAKLIVKDPATLSAQETADLERLKGNVIAFVGLADRPGRDTDFKVSA